MKHKSKALAIVILALLSCAGCHIPKSTPDRDDNSLASKQAKALRIFSQSAAVRDTVGAYTSTEGMRKLRVRGYGLVVGLGQNGSQTCPSRIRKKVAAEIRKKYGLGDSRLGLGNISPEKMINSPDTAVVLVEGEIGAGALASTQFDLWVQALRGTETTSLEGGRLYTCDLRYYRAVGGGTVQEGKIIAKGEGPLFINPFAQRDNTATPANLRAARVIGGGTNLVDRRVRLQLGTASYSRAISIQDRINSRFGRGAKIATADSPSYVALKIPLRYFGQELYFLALVRHLFLFSQDGAQESRALELIAELPDLAAPHDSIGLALEGIGKTIKPLIRNLYNHKLPHVTYFAARTGLHLRDTLAISPMEDYALDPESPFQMDAISDLGQAVDVPEAAAVLWKVVDSELDPRARLLAYEGLIEHQDPTIVSAKIGNQFILDLLPATKGPVIVYGKVSADPRLAVIGQARCRTPLFYRHPNGLVTMNSESGTEEITIVRTMPSGRISPPVAAPMELEGLLSLLGSKAKENKFGQVIGLGLSYSQVIDIVSALCASDAINAEFRLERPGAAKFLQPRRGGARPESDL